MAFHGMLSLGWLVGCLIELCLYSIISEYKSDALSKWLLLVSLVCVLEPLYWFRSARVVFPALGLSFPPLIPAGKSVITQ